MLIAILGIFASSSGCATSRPVSLPGSPGRSEFGVDQFAITPGDNVRVQLTSGEIRRGEVVFASQSEIVLKNADDHSAVDDTIAAAAIASMEATGEGLSTQEAMVTVLVAVVAAGAAFAMEMSSFNLF